MIDVDWNPDQKKLKQFGIISLFGFGIIGAVLGLRFDWFANDQWTVPLVLWGIGIVSSVLAFVQPAFLKPTYWILTAISAVIGPMIATFIMGAIFLLLFLPLGLIFRLKGRDELHRKILPDAASYWSGKPPAQEATRYFRQY
ncbi:MAG: SxtJ family membrane protein [Verrucomicrobiales bacterium]